MRILSTKMPLLNHSYGLRVTQCISPVNPDNAVKASFITTSEISCLKIDIPTEGDLKALVLKRRTKWVGY
jgi:hypothetical protein